MILTHLSHLAQTTWRSGPCSRPARVARVQHAVGLLARNATTTTNNNNDNDNDNDVTTTTTNNNNNNTNTDISILTTTTNNNNLRDVERKREREQNAGFSIRLHTISIVHHLHTIP